MGKLTLCIFFKDAPLLYFLGIEGFEQELMRCGGALEMIYYQGHNVPILHQAYIGIFLPLPLSQG